MAAMAHKFSAFWALLFSVLFGLSAAQIESIAVPTNSTTYKNETMSAKTSIIMVLDTQFSYNLQPLTPEALSILDDSTRVYGQSLLAQPSLSNDFTRASMVFMPCDPAPYSQGMIDQADVLQDAVEKNVSSIVYYSLTAKYCNFTSGPPPSNFSFIYSTTDSQDAETLYQRFASGRLGQMNILTVEGFQSWVKELNYDKASPSTAAAMIILYSITGVVTALFLIVIVTGAVRAHRHPERYGPRNTHGYPRQSRARGIARAMLDTIPIVKFGEKPKENVKPGDVELQDATSVESSEPRHTDTLTAEQQREQIQQYTAEADGYAGNTLATRILTENTPATAPSRSNSAPQEIAEDGLGCSICTEDFVQGQDIRVLPCDHKFHPACVDPWLLDVSGTCPLCRVDLRPADQRSTTSENPNDTSLPPPLDPGSANWRRRDLLVHILFNRHVDTNNPAREERILALRRFREQHRRRSELRDESIPGPATAEAERRRQERRQEEEETDRRRWARVRGRLRLGDRVR